MLSPATEDKYRDDGESENGMEGQKENEKQEGKISLTTIKPRGQFQLTIVIC